MYIYIWYIYIFGYIICSLRYIHFLRYCKGRQIFHKCSRLGTTIPTTIFSSNPIPLFADFFHPKTTREVGGFVVGDQVRVREGIQPQYHWADVEGELGEDDELRVCFPSSDRC